MRVIPIPCLKDNYAYLVVCEQTGEAGIVDPSEFAPVDKVIQAEGVNLTAILNTHHHWDHVGGNKELVAKYKGLRVYGHSSDGGRIDGQNQKLEHGSTFKLGAHDVKVLHNPGHTLGAITYVIEGCAFTGDTMFGGGCGRVFEGSMEMMHESLNGVIGALPGDTNIYFGHEYTENNLRFAQSVEPGNAALGARMADAQKARAAGRFTTPSTLALEKQTNPFLRCGEAEIAAAAKKAGLGGGSPAAVFGAIRTMKDRF
jgi:hydroxyacylglutathione hydrolase